MKKGVFSLKICNIIAIVSCDRVAQLQVFFLLLILIGHICQVGGSTC